MIFEQNKQFGIGIIGLFFVMIFTLFIFPVNAATPDVTDQCQCFCATPSGAKDIGKKKIFDCQESCKKSGNQMAVCAYKLAQYPSKNLRCFKASECQAHNGVLDTKQSQECVNGTRFCYPDPAKAAKLNLQIKIGETTVVSDIGQYLNALYKWLMVAGFTFAIVMTMIGGLQYVISAGSGGSSEGKKRITNGVTGLILLSCVYLILFTVNPYLVKLQVPKLPIIKTIVLATGDSCENMIKAGYTVDAGDKEKQCGTIGKVTKAPGDKEVPDGTTCDFTKCPNAGEKCAGSGETAKCVRCEQVTKSNEAKIVATSDLCSKLSRETQKVTKDVKGYKIETDKIFRCGYTKDADMIKGTMSATEAKLTSGTCAMITMDCSQIKSCEDYDTIVQVQNADKTQPLEDIQKIWLGLDNGDFGLETICEQNPCGIILDSDHGITETCKYNRDTDYSLYKKLKDDCVPRWKKK